MSTRTVVLLLLLAVGAAVAAARLLDRAPPGSPPDTPAPTPAPDASPPDAPAPAPAAPRHPAYPPLDDDAPLEAVVARLSGDAASDEIPRAALRARGAAWVGRLIELMASDQTALDGAGVLRWQVIQALVAIGRPAALPLAEAAAAAGDDSFVADAAWRALAAMGRDAAPATPLALRRLEASHDTAFRSLMLQVLTAAGPEAKEALPTVERLVGPPVDHDLIEAAAPALLAIAGPTPAALDRLRAAILHPETRARSLLAHAAGMAGAAAAPLLPVLADLTREGDEVIATQAAWAIGQIGAATPPALDALTWLLAYGTPGTRDAGAQALAALGPKGRERLLAIARQRRPAEERLAAYGALLQAGESTPVLLPVLLDILEGDEDDSAKARALGWLARVQTLPGDPRLLAALLRASETPRNSTQAFSILVRYPGEGPRAELLRRAREATDPRTTLDIVDAFTRHRIDVAEAAELILSVLERNPDPATALRALRGLAAVHPPPTTERALPVVRPHLEDADRYARTAAYLALGRLVGGDEQLIEVLLPALGDADPYVVSASAFAVGRFGDHADSIVPILLDNVAATAAGTGGRVDQNVEAALIRLAPRWAGTREALDQLIETADERSRPLLESLATRLFPHR